MPCPTHRAPRRRVPVALALALAAGCGDDVTSPAEALRITTTVSPATFRTGDSVTVTVTATNRGRQTQYILAQRCDDPFQVSDASGQTFAQVPRYCLLILYAPTPVAPGAQVTLTGVWRGYVAGPHTTPSDGTAAAPLPAGEYTLRGVVQSTDGERPLLVGAPVTVRIQP